MKIKTICYIIFLLGASVVHSSASDDAQLSPEVIQLGRKIINSWSDPDLLMWFREQTLNPIAKSDSRDGEFLRTALVGNAIELATKKNDLWAYHYLVQRLVLSEFKEEKSDIVGKLTVWSGAVELRFSSFPVLLRAAEAEPKGTLRYMILVGIKHLMKADPSLSMVFKPDLDRLLKSLSGDKDGINILN